MLLNGQESYAKAADLYFRSEQAMLEKGTQERTEEIKPFIWQINRKRLESEERKKKKKLKRHRN
jgi:hypothetical protein